MVGCVANLYASVEKIDSTYVQPGAAKDALLSPTVLSPAAGSANSSLLRLPESSSVKPKTFYRCSNTSYSACRAYVMDEHGRACPNCKCSMTTVASYLPSPAPGTDGSGQVAAEGLVQGIVTYTVMDDLTVTPMSAISSITLLNNFAVRDLGDLQEKTVQLGYNEVINMRASLLDLSSSLMVFRSSRSSIADVCVTRVVPIWVQGLEILKASLQSKSVLTDVFLAKKSPARGRAA
ncbi:hypothetical protein HU200_055536 [Digitaria exilis]|uniref:Uncharacterized protein n=1 Tax=Digitaria exilis TaxID=1010633 RepID=A0A835AGM2_9POAL|nr:hypothetical protein HU200_055536 [Digitaria exilis]